MREVSRKMVKLLREQRDGVCSRNTRVETGHVTLHGSVIATYEPERKRLHVTLAGWNTPTTRERVNSILRAFKIDARYFQRGHVCHLRQGGEDFTVSSRDVFAFNLD